MSYFVTGATGFIGRHLVQCLLEREGDIYVLVRESSQRRLQALIERWDAGAATRVKPVAGDLSEPLLGLSQETVDALRAAGIAQFFHLAAVYDITADDATNQLANVEGTRHAVQLANALEVGCLHHASSIAVAGRFKGLFREDMFDEGQKLDHPYYRTKFEAERIVRTKTTVPWHVYRPAIVVGNSKTGEMDKIDGPYYFFTLIKMARHLLPGWFPLVGPELGYTNIVPVDFVAEAIDYIAHVDGLDGQAFHLTNPKSQRSGELINIIAKAANAPQLSMRIDMRVLRALPKGTLSMLMALPAARNVRRAVLADFGIPEEVIGHIGLSAQFDTRDTERALAGSGIAVPEVASYADKLWDYWERNLDPDLFKDRSLEGALKGRTVLITGASSGIGRAAALRIAGGGATVLLVARGMDKLQETLTEIEDNGGTAFAYSTDLADPDSVDRLVAVVHAEHGAVDILVNNAAYFAASPLIDVKAAEAARFFAVNAVGPLNGARAMAKWTIEHRRSGAIVNVSSIAAGRPVPGLALYAASKAALESLTRSMAVEWAGKGLRVNAVAPGHVKTEGVLEDFRAGRLDEAAMLARIPDGRIDDGHDVADAVLFLCGERARHIIGHVLTVDGGEGF